MPIVVTCPACKAKLKAPEGLVGKKVKCPSCQGAVLVEQPAAAPAPRPPAQAVTKKKPVDDLEDLDDMDAPPAKTKAKKPAPVDDEDGGFEDLDEAPVKSKGKKPARLDEDDLDEDDLDERPARKKGRVDDEYEEDEDDRPRSKGKKKKGLDNVPTDEVTEEDMTKAFNLYLFTFLSGFCGVSLFVFLYLWLTGRKESPLVDWHGKQILNMSITSIVVGLLLMVISAAGAGIGYALESSVVAAAIAGLAGLAMVAYFIFTAVVYIMGMLKAKAGIYYRYPMTMQLLK